MTAYVGQSLALIDSKHRAVFYSHKTNGTQKCKIYSDKDKTSDIGNYSSLGHCNGATYADGSFYVCAYNGSKNTNKVKVVSAKTLKTTKTITASVGLSGIGYGNGTFVGSKGNTVYVFESRALQKHKSFKLKFTDGTPQDIAVHDHVIYVCRSYVQGRTSCIDTYTFAGRYLGSYMVSENELESCCIDEKGYIHYVTWNKAELVKSDRKVN